MTNFYCINAAIIYLSKFISKLNENCILVFRHINVVIWRYIHAWDTPLWTLTAMHCVTKTFYRLFHQWQHLHGNECYSNPNPNPNLNPNSNPNPNTNHVKNLNCSLQIFVNSIVIYRKQHAKTWIPKMFSRWRIYSPCAHGSEHWPVFITWLFAIYGTFTVIARASLFYGICYCVNVRNGTKAYELLVEMQIFITLYLIFLFKADWSFRS